MIPAKYIGKKIKKITKNEKDTPFIIRSVKGSDYAFVIVEPGKSYEISVDYTL